MQTTNQALRSYQQIGAVSQVAASSDPVRLVQLMLGNAVDRLALARGHVERGEIAAKAEQLSRVVAIVDTLNALVDLDKGGDIGRNLRDLYDYATRRLALANLRNDLAVLDEVAGLLREIRSGWDAMAAQPRPAAAGTP
jgi:flagellar protein FliS